MINKFMKCYSQRVHKSTRIITLNIILIYFLDMKHVLCYRDSMKYTINKFLNVRFLSFSVMLFSFLFSTSYCGEESVLTNIVKSLEDTILVVNQPVDSTVAGNSTATFSVVAVSQNSNQLTYQWQSITAGSAIVNTIKGATRSSYTTSKLTGSDSGTQYFVIITSSATGKVTSKRATVTVDTSVTVSTQPEDVNVGVGSTYTFNIVATSTTGSLSYQWQQSITGSTTFTDIPRATGSTYTTGILANSSNGTRYKVKLIVTGGKVVDSSIATLTVTDININSQPNSISVLIPIHNRAIFRVSATSTSGSALSYQWQKCIGGGTCIDIPGATNSTYETEVSVSDNRNEYRVVIKAAITDGFITKNSDSGRLSITQPISTTIAGTGVANFLDGASAQFNSPSGVAVDSSGNVYVADFGNHRIRKITLSGNTSTFAGTGTASFLDGASAQFNSPSGVAVDSSGNVYVADRSNHRIRKITPSGITSTIAGTGVRTLDGGVAGDFSEDTNGFIVAADGSISGITSQFASPLGVTVDSSGNIYVADTGNHRIRKITPSGITSTIAGTGLDNSGRPGGDFSEDTNGATVLLVVSHLSLMLLLELP